MVWSKNPQLFLSITFILKFLNLIWRLHAVQISSKAILPFGQNKDEKKTTKSALCEVRNEHTYPSGFSISHKTALFLDGGYLLQLVVWPMPATYSYERVITGYVTFITYLIN